MTEPEGDVRPPAAGADELVQHKGSRECPMLEPHPRSLCGIVLARERSQVEADRRRREAGPA